MEWSDYSLVLAVVRERTLRGAARSLGINHATVSRRLAYLNDGPLGPLVQKSPSGFWPTKAGEAIVDAAKKMESAAEAAKRKQRAIEHNLSGPLSISIPVLFLQHVLIDDIATFAQLYPETDLTINSTDAFVDLDRAEADIALRASHEPPDHWMGRRLFTYSISLYAHKDYLANTRPDDLRWVAPPVGEARWQSWLKDSPYPDAQIGLTITDIAGRFHAIRNGLGMGRAACFMAETDPNLIRLPGAALVEAEPLWLLCHPDFARTSRAKTAMKFFADALHSHRNLLQPER